MIVKETSHNALKVNKYMSKYRRQHGALNHTKQQAIMDAKINIM